LEGEREGEADVGAADGARDGREDEGDRLGRADVGDALGDELEGVREGIALTGDLVGEDDCARRHSTRARKGMASTPTAGPVVLLAIAVSADMPTTKVGVGVVAAFLT